MEPGDRDDVLSRLADATAGLAPDDGLVDAVMERVAPPDALAELASATRGLAPTDALSDAVMDRLSRARPVDGARARPAGRDAAARASWLGGVVRVGPFALGAAAVAAAASVALFLSNHADVEATVASSFDAVEVAE